MRKYAAKVDQNQAEIVKALRDAGCGVEDLSRVGGGMPDLLVHEPCFPWNTILIEVKNGDNSPSGQRLTEDQKKFWKRWKGRKCLVRNVEEALEAVGVKRDE